MLYNRIYNNIDGKRVLLIVLQLLYTNRELETYYIIRNIHNFLLDY